jgi:hypothetical protein
MKLEKNTIEVVTVAFVAIISDMKAGTSLMITYE